VAVRRRVRGEGSIYRRKDGRYVGQYETPGKRRYIYGKTRAETAGEEGFDPHRRPLPRLTTNVKGAIRVEEER
jgi:hypothetical protein